jgi:hypothetical protein
MHHNGPTVDHYYDPIPDLFDAVTPLVPSDYLQSIAQSTARADFSRRVKELNFAAG